MPITRDQRADMRDKRVQETFGDLAPIWLSNDVYRPGKDSFYFNLVFYHPVHGWINQRERFDTFTNVLYHLGEARISEEAMLTIQEGAPFIAGAGSSTTPNNPANRH